MQYSEKVHGVNLVCHYKASAMIGGQVKYRCLFKHAIFLGDAKIRAQGSEKCKNGDLKIVEYKRNVEFGVISEFKVANRGNLVTWGIIRDVERRRWDRFYEAPKSLKNNAPLRHLDSDHFLLIGQGSAEHSKNVKDFAGQLGFEKNRRIQSQFGHGHESKTERKGGHFYRSRNRADYIHQIFHEMSIKDLEYEKHEDGSETTTFTGTILGGQDTIKIRTSGERRIGFIRFDRRCHGSSRLEGTTINQYGKFKVEITTRPDGTFDMTAKINGKNFTDSEHKIERKKGMEIEYFYRDNDISGPSTLSGSIENGTGKIFTESRTNSRIERDKMICRREKGGGRRHSKWTGLKKDSKSEKVIVEDNSTYCWSKNLPENAVIEVFSKNINGAEVTLHLRFENFESFKDALDPTKDFAKFTSQGSYEASDGPGVETAVLTVDGSPVHIFHGMKLSQTLNVSSAKIGYIIHSSCLILLNLCLELSLQTVP